MREPLFYKSRNIRLLGSSAHCKCLCECSPQPRTESNSLGFSPGWYNIYSTRSPPRWQRQRCRRYRIIFDVVCFKMQINGNENKKKWEYSRHRFYKSKSHESSSILNISRSFSLCGDLFCEYALLFTWLDKSKKRCIQDISHARTETKISRLTSVVLLLAIEYYRRTLLIFTCNDWWMQCI